MNGTCRRAPEIAAADLVQEKNRRWQFLQDLEAGPGSGMRTATPRNRCGWIYGYIQGWENVYAIVINSPEIRKTVVLCIFDWNHRHYIRTIKQTVQGSTINLLNFGEWCKLSSAVLQGRLISKMSVDRAKIICVQVCVCMVWTFGMVWYGLVGYGMVVIMCCAVLYCVVWHCIAWHGMGCHVM